ncbi:MAG: hypothetical protein JWM44_2063 [Bacilli bacterium]|nr:hypothetical protein [Bacilli bacterium]
MLIEKIAENPKDTAKKIRAALKMVFPSFDHFNVKAGKDSINVYWVDGPLKPDVQKVLYRFESYPLQRGNVDRKHCLGYEWEGQIYVGPGQLNAFRHMSEERRVVLKGYMLSESLDYDASVDERVAAERKAIKEGFLQGVMPKCNPELMRDQKPEIPRVDQPAKEPIYAAGGKKKEEVQDAKYNEQTEPLNMAVVLPFIKKNRIELPLNHPALANYTSEQRFKLAILQMMHAENFPMENLVNNRITVDEMFTLTANALFK